MLRAPADLTGAQHFSMAFAIKRTYPDRKQKHVALLYKDEASNWVLLHLGWHHLLFHEPWDGKYHWVAFDNLAPEVAEGFTDMARIIADQQANKKIPYSVTFTGGQYFGEDGVYVRHGAGEGLTCATFLLAIFRRWGLPLVDESTWPQGRSGDAPWALKIVRGLYRWAKLEKAAIPLQHYIEQLRQRWALTRFRPEEVCACAGIFDGNPLAFATVSPRAEKLLRDLP